VCAPPARGKRWLPLCLFLCGNEVAFPSLLSLHTLNFEGLFFLSHFAPQNPHYTEDEKSNDFEPCLRLSPPPPSSPPTQRQTRAHAYSSNGQECVKARALAHPRSSRVARRRPQRVLRRGQRGGRLRRRGGYNRGKGCRRVWKQQQWERRRGSRACGLVTPRVLDCLIHGPHSPSSVVVVVFSSCSSSSSSSSSCSPREVLALLFTAK
jgi:hypothetical protein